MSFLKSYYNSVSSYLVGEDNESNDNQNLTNEETPESCQVKESKSESWLSGIYNSAYNSSGEVWRAVKTDLNEFATVVSKDAKTVVAKTATGVKHGLVGEDENVDCQADTDQSSSTTSKIKASLNRMFEQVSKTLYIPPDDDEDDFYYNNRDSGSQTICTRIDTRIAQLQSDRHTFTSDPIQSEQDVDLGDFGVWKEKLKMDDFQSTIAELVKNHASLLDHFTELVPEKVSFEEFWARYFYRVASVKAEESRREALKLRICHEERVGDVGTDGGDWDEADDMREEACAVPSTSVVGAATEVVEVVRNEAESAHVTKAEDQLKVRERNDVVVVKHVESSSASEDNQCEETSPEQRGEDLAGWDDDDIEVEVTAEELEMAKAVSDKDVLESKWEDWS